MCIMSFLYVCMYVCMYAYAVQLEEVIRQYRQHITAYQRQNKQIVSGAAANTSSFHRFVQSCMYVCMYVASILLGCLANDCDVGLDRC